MKQVDVKPDKGRVNGTILISFVGLVIFIVLLFLPVDSSRYGVNGAKAIYFMVAFAVLFAVLGLVSSIWLKIAKIPTMKVTPSGIIYKGLLGTRVFDWADIKYLYYYNKGMFRMIYIGKTEAASSEIFPSRNNCNIDLSYLDINADQLTELIISYSEGKFKPIVITRNDSQWG